MKLGGKYLRARIKPIRETKKTFTQRDKIPNIFYKKEEKRM